MLLVNGMATSLLESPCLNLSVARLSTTGNQNFAIWVLKAPYPGGYVLHDCQWSQTVAESWQAWQQMFAAPKPTLGFPNLGPVHLAFPAELGSTPFGQMTNYSGRLMQDLGISLYQWLFEGPIQNSLAQSQGIALGQNKPLRLRLEIRDPDLIALPWEIMQPQPGRPAISLSGQLLFSRTSSAVDPLPPQRTDRSLNILLVLGENSRLPETSSNASANLLQLEHEAATLVQTLQNPGIAANGSNSSIRVKCLVDTLLQPTPEQLISKLENTGYNVFFYAGHGEPGPDGGLVFLRPGMQLNGTELAQVLTRCGVTLCVVNACWGAQPAVVNQQTLPRSSLAEVLIHHGVPAVLGMRDEIADCEALSFIQAFAEALRSQLPIDQAVAIARQQLLALYRFNQPAWTLPVLYLHPEFDGELIRIPNQDITQLPEFSISGIKSLKASLRSLSNPKKVWSLRSGAARVGRRREANDIVISEPWISQEHAEIFCRNGNRDAVSVPMYFLRDNSRYGTLLLGSDGCWQKVHRQEVPLQSGMQLKFGSSQGQAFEFIIES